MRCHPAGVRAVCSRWIYFDLPLQIAPAPDMIRPSNNALRSYRQTRVALRLSARASCHAHAAKARSSITRRSAGSTASKACNCGNKTATSGELKAKLRDDRSTLPRDPIETLEPGLPLMTHSPMAGQAIRILTIVDDVLAVITGSGADTSPSADCRRRARSSESRHPASSQPSRPRSVSDQRHRVRPRISIRALYAT